MAGLLSGPGSLTMTLTQVAGDTLIHLSKLHPALLPHLTRSFQRAPPAQICCFCAHLYGNILQKNTGGRPNLDSAGAGTIGGVEGRDPACRGWSQPSFQLHEDVWKYLVA